jgi:hypothetical protein
MVYDGIYGEKDRTSVQLGEHPAFNIFNRAKEAIGMKNLGFYMSTYIIDAIFSVHHFPAFEWSWTPIHPPIHIYC